MLSYVNKNITEKTAIKSHVMIYHDMDNYMITVTVLLQIEHFKRLYYTVGLKINLTNNDCHGNDKNCSAIHD